MGTRLCVLVAVAAVAGGAAPIANAGAPAVKAILTVDANNGVSILSLAGRKLAVPERVGQSPLGLSPDGRLIAIPTDNGIQLGPVRGGNLKTVITGRCDTANGPVCSFGASPSFAWSPDGRRLAVAVNRHGRSTLLEIVDRGGAVGGRFALPARNPERGGQAYHVLVSWSPDSRRLLLVREDEYYDSAVVTLDVTSGRLRTLARVNEPHDNPALAWSPDGKLVAMTSEGRSSKDYAFAVVDASSGAIVVGCKAAQASCRPLSTVWADDARSLYTEVAGSSGTNWIDRVSLTGTAHHVLKSERGFPVPLLGLSNSLVYQDSPTVTGSGSPARNVLYRYDFTTKRRTKLGSTRVGFVKVVPLTTLPGA